MLPLISTQSNAICDGDRIRLLTRILGAAATAGTVLRSGEDLEDLDMRHCSVADVDDPAVDQLLTRAFLSAARQLAGEMVDSLTFDGPMLVRYPVGGMFRAHRDVSDDPADPAFVRFRKLTLICFLNDYRTVDHALPRCEGGALVVYRPSADGTVEPVSFMPEAGQVVVFDSTLLHEVRPVLRGERVTAVAWLYQQGGFSNA